MKGGLTGAAIALAIGFMSSPATAQADATVFVVHGINGENQGWPEWTKVDISSGDACALTGFTCRAMTGGISLTRGR